MWWIFSSSVSLFAILIQTAVLGVSTPSLAKRELASDMSKFVEDCIRSLPDKKGDLDQLQFSVRNCSKLAYEEALKTSPDNVIVKKNIDAIHEAEREEAGLPPGSCPRTNIFTVMHPVKVFWEEPILPCYSKAQACVGKAKQLSEPIAIVSGIAACMAYAHSCRADILQSLNRTLQAETGRRMVDQFAKIFLAFSSGKQSCTPGATTCITGTNCGRYLIPLLLSMDKDTRYITKN